MQKIVVAVIISLLAVALFYVVLQPLAVESCVINGYKVWRSCVPFQPVLFSVILALLAAGASWLILEYLKARLKIRILVSGLLFGVVLLTVLVA